MSSANTANLSALSGDSWSWKFASIAIGLGASVVIFFGLALVQKQRVAAPPAVVDDLHAIARRL